MSESIDFKKKEFNRYQALFFNNFLKLISDGETEKSAFFKSTKKGVEAIQAMFELFFKARPTWAQDGTIGSWERGISTALDEITQLKAENAKLREELSSVINFIPEGWEVPFGYSQIVASAREALEKTKEADSE